MMNVDVKQIPKTEMQVENSSGGKFKTAILNSRPLIYSIECINFELIILFGDKSVEVTHSRIHSIIFILRD